jgi:hypothetical protein
MDARMHNWRFVVPDEPEGLLHLPADGELLPSAAVVEPGPDGLAAALRRGPYPAIAAPDIGLWSRHRPAEASRTLARLAAAVAPGGWLCAGFANANYPGTPALAGGLRMPTARRVLRCAGFTDIEEYIALPNQRCPALLVPAARSMELNHVLRQLFLTYVPGEGMLAMAQRHLLTLLRRGALVTPHGIRARFAPGFFVVARRSA